MTRQFFIAFIGLFLGPCGWSAQADEMGDKLLGQPAPRIELSKALNCDFVPSNENLLGRVVLFELYDTR